jgi:hypothetical protein
VKNKRVAADTAPLVSLDKPPAADIQGRRVLAIVLAAACLVVTIMAILVAVIADALSENDDQFHSLALPAAFTFALSALTFGAVALGRWRLAVGAFALQAASSMLLLGKALHISAHSDGKLVAFAAAVEIPGLIGVLLVRPRAA